MAGRPAHDPTDKMREQVRSHIAVGTTQEDVARLMGISVDTLAKHYRAEIDTAVAQANATVAGKLFSTATGKRTGATVADETRAQIFWLKTRAGWRETERHEVVGDGGGPVRTTDEPFIDATKLTTDELEQLQALVKKGAHDKPQGGD